jgi:hypothetical protein
MYQTINLHDFRQAFQEIRPNNFSYEGLETLFNHFEQLENDLNEKIELDVIALCCDYTEALPRTIAHDYNIEVIAGRDDPIKTVLAYLENRTCIIGITENKQIIYQNF